MAFADYDMVVTTAWVQRYMTTDTLKVHESSKEALATHIRKVEPFRRSRIVVPAPGDRCIDDE